MAETANNVTNLRPEGDDIRSARAAHIHGLLKGERWSIRQAAMSLGVTNSVLASRMKGETPFLADELEMIADLLNREPVEFYAEYRSVGIAPEPRPTGGGVTFIMQERGPYRARTDDIHGGMVEVDAIVTPIRKVKPAA